MVNIRSLLDDHEAATVERIAKLRAELVPLERELFEIRLAKSALDRTPANSPQPELFSERKSVPNAATSHEDRWRSLVVHSLPTIPKSPYARLTIKELIVKGLQEQFELGATASQLLELFASAWGRTDVVRTSLSPQLSRLKQDGELIRDGQRWRLAPVLRTSEQNTATDQ